VFDTAHDNVAANDTIEDSRPSIQMFRSASFRSAPTVLEESIFNYQRSFAEGQPIK
jgi:hypothetical protein